MRSIYCCSLAAALLAGFSASPAYGQEVQKQDVEKEADQIVERLAEGENDEAVVASRVLDAGRKRKESDPLLHEALLKRAYSRARGDKGKWPSPEVGIEAARVLIEGVSVDSRPEWQDNLLAALTKQWEVLKAKRDSVARRRTVSPADKLKKGQEVQGLDEHLTEKGTALLDEMLAIIDQWILEGRYGAAIKKCREAASLEKKGLETGRDKEIVRRRTLSTKMKQWKEKLDKNPDSTQARKDLIKGYVVYLDRPDEVVRLGLLVDSVKGDNEYGEYQNCVPLAVKERLDEPECLALGGQYYLWAKGVRVPTAKGGALDPEKGDPLEVFAKQSMLRRTVRYYQEYIKAQPEGPKRAGDWDVVYAHLKDANRQLAELQGPINLLALIDLAKHPNSKTWSRSGSEIVASKEAEEKAGAAGWLIVPVAVSTSYRLDCEFSMPHTYGHLHVYVPVDTCMCRLKMYATPGLGRFRDDGTQPLSEAGEVVGKKGLTGAGPHRLTVEVSDLGDNKWGIAVWLDDPNRKDPLMTWRGPASALIENSLWQQRAASGSFCLETGKGEGFSFQKLMLQMTSGEAVTLKD